MCVVFRPSLATKPSRPTSHPSRPRLSNTTSATTIPVAVGRSVASAPPTANYAFSSRTAYIVARTTGAPLHDFAGGVPAAEPRTGNCRSVVTQWPTGTFPQTPSRAKYQPSKEQGAKFTLFSTRSAQTPSRTRSSCKPVPKPKLGANLFLEFEPLSPSRPSSLGPLRCLRVVFWRKG